MNKENPSTIFQTLFIFSSQFANHRQSSPALHVNSCLKQDRKRYCHIFE